MPASTLTATVNVTGYFCLYLAVAMLLPMAVDIGAGNEDWQVFLLSSFLVAGIALAMIVMTHGYPMRFSPRFGFIVLNALWLSTSLVAALPLYFSSLDLTMADAVFEAVSGITTTGSTVLVGLDGLPPGLLLWRSVTHWLGGIGVVATGLLLLPFLNVGGMQIFKLESSSQAESPFPRFRQFSIALLSFYVAITFACTLAYSMAGMTLFEAVNHAMATISTGGFSTRDASFREFGEAALIVGIIFMLLGAMPFAVLIRAIVQRDIRSAYDPQVPVLLTIVGLSAFTVTVLAVEHLEVERWSVVIHAVFNVVSIITTTGFVSADYDQWGPLSVGIFFLLTFLGGCAGSTVGGIKIYRLMVLFQTVRVNLRQMVRPDVVLPVRYGAQTVSSRVIQSVAVFVGIYLAIFLVAAVALTATGLDFITALSGAITALSNVGPGFGTLIGPAGTFADVPETAKWILSGTMLLGRLEVMAVLILFSPSFWRHF
ncbi:TrkH family potassium uptake protein [Pararhizobium haloflavum]|uniref:TrkH family potassium uptake protein n=1 Tax=Pararhizobium haloflavum TaxID=2037914 RepID=UPI001FDFD2EB|nr:TrkH family potassium uptake protein [Pararhizobium haloflavum]